jgi:2-polyprenyl-3-methyl-5-hydroxy-6-metoxy-1,4-benzoquinol methylase
VTVACRICGNGEGNRGFVAREMMLGLRDRFHYQECGRCGALQIDQIPADLGRYYAPPYYAFAPLQDVPALRRWLSRRLAAHALGAPDPVGALVARVRGVPETLRGIRAAGLGLGARVLDVGSGAGQALFQLHAWGFRNLLGVDPYIDRDLDYPNGVRVRRAALDAVDGPFDLITFNHSFEHVPDPNATLAAAAARLAPGGWILVRTPVAAASWEEYGADWVELDAPRHLHVHTEASMAVLARAVGLEIRRVVGEAYPLEIWGSEQYRRDIPLADPRSHFPGGEGRVFGRREMRAFRRRAAALNRSGRAGRAAFWLTAAQPAPSNG